MCKDLDFPGKGNGYRPLLALILVLDLDLRFKVIDFKIELKVVVGFLFCDLIVWLPCTGDGGVKIVIVAT